MKTLKTFWFLLLLSILFSHTLFAQREADNWIIGNWIDVNFTSGDPTISFVGPYGNTEFEGATMSDSLGNLLFFYGDATVYNRDGEVMLNGDNILPEWHSENKYELTIPKPGSNSKYYIFGVTSDQSGSGIYYSVIDMSLDGGLGGVTYEKNIKLEAANNAQGKIFALKNATGDGYWVVTRLFLDDRYASFRVTASGVDPVPVYSPTGIYRLLSSGSGPMRISQDKKYLISCFWTYIGVTGSLEVCSFNAQTGAVGFKYLFQPGLIGKAGNPMDCEISPDSKYLYVNWLEGVESDNGLYQYNMKLIDDSASFFNSGIHLLNQTYGNIQLSNDGRIYFAYNTDPDLQHYQRKYLGVINRPWDLGTACDIDTNGVYMGGRERNHYLPNILLDYLYRFEWEADNHCVGTPVHFIPHFIPTPDSIEWNFDEFAPGNISHELAPTYAFQFPGTHEVKVDIWYPTGRFEHTSREIEIFPIPHPDLGPDTLICEGTSLTLYANCDADFYAWNGIPGISQYTVNDTGFYRVSATFFETGCHGSDTIHVGFYPPILIDESSLVVTPTSCGGATGSVAGLTVQGTDPLQYLWEDLSGNDYGTGIDVNNLPAGQYVLTITDANGCETSSSTFTITDAGNLQVTQVQFTAPHCFRPDGQLIITAFAPPGSILEYSIDNGSNYTTDSIFTGLLAGSYVVRIRDNNGCEGFYVDNPILLQDIPGPQVTQVNVTNETDFLGNGAIEIIASGSTTEIYYSIDSGATWQLNDGSFYNLQSRIYNLQIKDENGCDTAFTVEIQNIILTYLHAITGPGGHCLGNTAMVPVNVDNFNSVADFHLTLGYNADNLQCEGFTNVQPELLDSLTGWVDQAAGEIYLAWKSPTPVTFPGTEKVADLVFTTKNPGQGELTWYTGTTESYFTNSTGNPIPAQFSTGEVNIYEPPEIILDQSRTVCNGQFVSLMSIAIGNQPPIDYRWIYPTGDTTSNDPFFFSVTQANAGIYTLLATDHVGCTDQKSIELIVSDIPFAAFHGTDTLEMHSGDVLDAGPGMASYRWSPGDTTQSIVIQAEGKYSVEMESLFGCIGRDSIYVKLASEEIPEFKIFVPNAFRPDGDGINDSFNISYNNNTFPISHFVLDIFNRWGEEIFHSDDISRGWDGKKNGKDCPGGVYVYKIVFSVDGVAGSQERVGTVMLVR